MCGHRAGRAGRRLRLPEGAPPRLNYSILTGRLTADPRLARSPYGDPVVLLHIEFPVTDPERPQLLWGGWSSCEIEVPDALAERYGVCKLEMGASILVVGQISERWTMEPGRVGKRAAIVAAFVHPDSSAKRDELLVAGGRP